MSSPIISVIVVNYNGRRYLGECLMSLYLQTFRDFEVIVVDNGSTDGSVEFIRKDFPWVKLISLNKNSGFTIANNIGFNASSSKYIVTLNNDTIVDKGWLQALYEAAELDSRIGMVASKIFLGRNGRKIDSVGILIYPDGMSKPRGRGKIDQGEFDRIEEVLIPSCCAAMFRREMLNEIGFLDEDFFMFCEDMDLALRAWLAGWRAVLAPKAFVRHLYSQTVGQYSEMKIYYIERNRLWVLVKDLPASYILLAPFYSLWRYIVQVYGLLSKKGVVARFAESNKKGRLIAAIIKAYIDGLIKLPIMLKKRKEIWKYRKLPIRDYKNLLCRYRITAKELILSELV